MPDKIKLDNIYYNCGNTRVFEGLGFCVAADEAVIIAGRSGQGKSTMLEISAGIRQPDSGQVFWDDQNINKLSRPEILKSRRSMGYVFQKHALICNSDIYNNIALPLRYHTSGSEAQIRDRVWHLIELFGLQECTLKYPEALSAGQAKCAAIARALIMDPTLLFLDEPTAGLDPKTSARLVEVLQKIRVDRKITILMVTHSLTAIRDLKWPFVIIENGRLRDYRNDGTIQTGGAIEALIQDVL